MEKRFGDLKKLENFTTGWNSDTYRKVIPQYSAGMGFCEVCMLMKAANCINNRTSKPDHLCEDAVVFSQSRVIDHGKKFDKLFITEILNDLHRHGFIIGGKAETMLHDWASELRTKTRSCFPASRLKKVFCEVIGRYLW